MLKKVISSCIVLCITLSLIVPVKAETASISSDTVITKDNISEVLEYLKLDPSSFVQSDITSQGVTTVGELQTAIGQASVQVNSATRSANGLDVVISGAYPDAAITSVSSDAIAIETSPNTGTSSNTITIQTSPDTITTEASTNIVSNAALDSSVTATESLNATTNVVFPDSISTNYGTKMLYSKSNLSSYELEYSVAGQYKNGIWVGASSADVTVDSKFICNVFKINSKKLNINYSSTAITLYSTVVVDAYIGVGNYGLIKINTNTITGVRNWNQSHIPAPLYPGYAIKSGSTGSNVILIQNRLKFLGLYFGSVDGSFGSATKSAVINFQRSRSLTADGIVGANTWYALFK